MYLVIIWGFVIITPLTALLILKLGEAYPKVFYCSCFLIVTAGIAGCLTHRDVNHE